MPQLSPVFQEMTNQIGTPLFSINQIRILLFSMGIYWWNLNWKKQKGLMYSDKVFLLSARSLSCDPGFADVYAVLFLSLSLYLYPELSNYVLKCIHVSSPLLAPYDHAEKHSDCKANKSGFKSWLTPSWLCGFRQQYYLPKSQFPCDHIIMETFLFYCCINI